MDRPAQSIVYKNAAALLMLPQYNTEDVPEEVFQLNNTFAGQYRYHCGIDLHNAWTTLDDGPDLTSIDQRDDALRILYYRGPNDAETLVETLKYISQGDIPHPPALNGEALRQYADVLCILDCPLPADWEDIADQIIAARPPAQHTRTSLFEILAANPTDWTPESHSRSPLSTPQSPESDFSFLQSFCWALETLVDARENTSVAELAAKIRDAPDLPRDQLPVHKICNPSCLERIILCPSASPGAPIRPNIPARDDEPAKKTVRKDVLGLRKVLKRKQRKRDSMDDDSK